MLSMQRKGYTYSWGRGGHEDQAAKVCGALVAEGSGGVDQSANTVTLEGRSDELYG